MFQETLAALDLTVLIGDRRLRPTLKPGDLVRFEQHFGRSLVNPTGEVSFGVTEMFFLGWAALKRTGEYEGDFDKFCDDVDDVDMGEPGKAVAPAGSPSPA